MKFIFIFFISTIFSTQAFGMKLICVTETPSTSIVGEDSDGLFTVTVFHHFGFKYMPLHSGILTPNDLEKILKKSEIFERLGDLYEFSWDPSKCKRTDSDLFNCYGGNDTVMNGISVKPFSISSKRISSEIPEFRYEQIEISFLIEIEGESYHFSMIYSKDECLQEDKANKVWPINKR